MLVSPSGMEILKVNRQGGPARVWSSARKICAGRMWGCHPFLHGNRAPTILLGEPVKSFANPVRKERAAREDELHDAQRSLMRRAPVGPHGLAYVIDSRGGLWPIRMRKWSLQPCAMGQAPRGGCLDRQSGRPDGVDP